MKKAAVAETIRLAQGSDAERIREIYAPFILRSGITFETEVPSGEEMRNRISEIRSKFPFLVYTSDAHVLGYAYASPHRSRCAYSWSVESTVYVDPEFQRRRIATRLYQALFALLKSQKVVNVYAAIAQPNAPSVRLHEELGFKHLGTFTDAGYKLDRWWDVGWWQTQIQRPDRPEPVLPPATEL